MQPTTAATELERRVTPLADQARSLEVTDQETYDLAAERLRALVKLRDEIVEHHREMKSRSYQAWQAVIAAEKKLLEPVTNAERIYKQRVAAYQTEQERIAAEARAQADREAQTRAAEQREREIEQAEAAGADAEEVAALIAEPLPVVLPDLPPATFQKAAGISTANSWKGQCVSLAQLLKAIVEGKASIGLVLENQPAINALARATRGTLPVAGIRFYSEPTVRTRR